MDRFFVFFTNWLYLVPFQVQKFKKQEPEAVVLAAGATKAQLLAEDREVQFEIGWVTSRRAVLILTTEKLVCGNWIIPLATIKKASLLRVQSTSSKGYVLKVSTDDGAHYQFGLQRDPAWERQTSLKLTLEEGEIKPTELGKVLRMLRWIVLLTICGWFGIPLCFYLAAQAGIFR